MCLSIYLYNFHIALRCCIHTLHTCNASRDVVKDYAIDKKVLESSSNDPRLPAITLNELLNIKDEDRYSTSTYLCVCRLVTYPLCKLVSFICIHLHLYLDSKFAINLNFHSLIHRFVFVEIILLN